METSIRILLIDDHAMFLASLRMLIDNQPGMKVIGEATNKVQAVEIAGRGQPNIIILDLLMGGEHGLDYITELMFASPKARIIVLTGALEPTIHQKAIQMGAMGLVHKTKAPDILIKAIEKVYQGEAWIDRLTMGMVLAEISRNGKKEETTPTAAKIALITKREREIISLVAKGLKNKQIADRLHLSDITVRHHLTSIFSKLEVTDRFELIVFAYNHSLCDLPK